eukprot:4637945-Amphidinium_carterae.2
MPTEQPRGNRSRSTRKHPRQHHSSKSHYRTWKRHSNAAISRSREARTSGEPQSYVMHRRSSRSNYRASYAATTNLDATSHHNGPTLSHSGQRTTTGQVGPSASHH